MDSQEKYIPTSKHLRVRNVHFSRTFHENHSIPRTRLRTLSAYICLRSRPGVLSCAVHMCIRVLLLFVALALESSLVVDSQNSVSFKRLSTSYANENGNEGPEPLKSGSNRVDFIHSKEKATASQICWWTLIPVGSRKNSLPSKVSLVD